MTCEEVRSCLSWFLDDELDPIEARAVRAHLLDGCAGCGARLAELRLSDGEIREAVKGIRPSARFVGKVVSKVSRPRPPWVRKLALAAALLLVLIGGAAVTVNSRQPPPLVVFIHGNQSFHADSLGSLRVLVSDATRGSPVANAAVRLLLAGSEVGRYATNAAGTIDGFFRVPDLKEGSYPLQVEVDSSIGNESLTRTITVRREVRLLLSTDKPMYQPGQTIQMRALALNAFTLKPRPGEGEFEVLDSKGNRIFSKKATLSEFGIAHAELPLADEINLGTYRVGFMASGLSQERTIEVAKYVLPKFRVHVELEKSSVLPGEVIRGKAKASYFFGEPVRGRAKVTAGPELVSGDLREAGVWEFQVQAPMTEGRVPLEMTVTDTADHRETKVTGVVVSRESLKVVLYPEGGSTVTGAKNVYYVLVSYPDGRPAKAEVSLIVNGALLQASTDDLGVARIVGGDPHGIRLTRARDSSGHETSQMEPLGDAGTIDFAIQLDKPSFKVGETMTVRVIGRPDGPVFIDLVKGGQLLLTRSIEKGEVAIDLPHDLFGTVQVIAYTPGSGHPVVRLANVNPPDGLRIRPRISKETFRPGEEMPVDLEVTDKDGKPTQAALGIAVVDEALFGLVDSKLAGEKAWLSLAPELIDTRGYLRAGSGEIYHAKNPNAQGFVSGNGHGTSPAAILDNNYAEKYMEIQESTRRFNLWLSFIAMVTVLLLAAALVLFIVGIPLVQGARAMISRHVSVLTLLWILLAMALFMTLGAVAAGTGGVIAIMLLGTLIAVTAHAADWWLRRGRIFAGCIAILLIPASIPIPFSLDLFRDSHVYRQEFRESANEGGGPEAEGEVEVVKKSWFDLRKGSPWPWSRSRFEAIECMKSPTPADLPGPVLMTLPYSRPAPPDKPARIRVDFPETLFWMPELITDEKGRARVTLPPADSITSWRMLASGVSRTGRLGFEQANLKVFQDFFVDIDFPVALTKGDRVHVPVTVYSYLKEPQSVTVRVQKESWFELLDEGTKSITLKPGEVSVAYFGLQVKEHGRKALTVFAEGKVKDAIRRSVEVMEKGREIPLSVSDRIAGRHTFRVEIPDRAIDGATVLFVRLTPGVGDLLTSLQGLIRMPDG